MNLSRLELFMHVVETGSLSAGAKRAFLSQPAMSRALKQLEAQLGVSLFERVGRGMVLSSAGRALVPQAKALIASSVQIEREIRRTWTQGYYDVRLGSIDSVAAKLLPSALADLRQAFDGLRVTLSTDRTRVLLEQVKANQMDMAIVAHSGPPPKTDALRLGRYALKYYGRRDLFPSLAKVKTEAELEAFPRVSLDSPTDSALEEKQEHSRAYVSNVSTLKALVLAGFGVGDLTDFMLTPTERKRLIASPMVHDPLCGLYLVLGAGWQSGRNYQVAHSLANSLKDELKKLEGEEKTAKSIT